MNETTPIPLPRITRIGRREAYGRQVDLGSPFVSIRVPSWLTLLILFAAVRLVAAVPELRDAVKTRVDAEYASLEAIYKDLHAHPELSFMEVKTAALIAGELRKLGFEVTEKVGNTGVVAVMKNGPGPTVLVRGDMDALPMPETTGLTYASKASVKDLAGNDRPAMHACAHDAHVTGLIGTARVLAAVKASWSGTVVIVGQPAEEIGSGARAMLADGLFSRFPRPDFALALHVWGTLPAGTVGYADGPSYANVDSIDIVVRGIGAHGSRPHLAKDPIVLAAEIVTTLQTIVSRELEPGTPAVVTVGSIHGGTTHNIIPEDVKLQLTLRSYDDAVADRLIASVRRIAANLARAAGMAEDRLPVVTVVGTRTPVTFNNSELTQRLAGTFRQWFGDASVRAEKATTAGEDFSLYGRTDDHVPICIWWVGATSPEKFAPGADVAAIPSNHNPNFAPVPEPTIKAAVTSMSAAVLELLGKK